MKIINFIVVKKKENKRLIFMEPPESSTCSGSFILERKQPSSRLSSDKNQRQQECIPVGCVPTPSVEFFTVCTKLAEMAILYSKDLTKAKKKLPPVGLDLMLQIITGLGVQCLTK